MLADAVAVIGNPDAYLTEDEIAAFELDAVLV